MSPSTQVVEEVPCAGAPVDVQVLGEERRHDHAGPVVHEAFARQLAHAGVDDGVAGATVLPRCERARVVVPAVATRAVVGPRRLGAGRRGSGGRSRASRAAGGTGRRPASRRRRARPRAATRTRSAGTARVVTSRHRRGRRGGPRSRATSVGPRVEHAAGRTSRRPASCRVTRVAGDQLGERRERARRRRRPGATPRRRGRRRSPWDLDPPPPVGREHLVVVALTGHDCTGRHDGHARQEVDTRSTRWCTHASVRALARLRERAHVGGGEHSFRAD